MNKKQIIILSLLFFVIVYLMPFLFSRGWLANIADFSNDATSNIGSTIGGITAPLIGIVSSILLYLALTKQTEANKIQKIKNETDTILSLFKQMEDELSVIYYSYEVNAEKENRRFYSYQGIQALDEWINTLLFKDNRVKDDDKFEHYFLSGQISLVIRSFEVAETRVKELPSEESIKDVLSNKLTAFYNYRLKKPLSLIELISIKYPQLDDEDMLKIKEFTTKYGKAETLMTDMKKKANLPS